MNKKTAVLLINVGTPDTPSIKSVRRFLFQFLNDKYVIDLPFFLRKFLVNGIIIPFRAPKSAKLYEELWEEKGSPLLYYSQTLQTKLQHKLTDHYDVYIGMRYGSPSIKEAIQNMSNKGYKKLILFPLYPQYATSTTLTSIIETKKQIKKQKLDIELETIDQFFDNEKFIDSIITNAKKHDLSSYDHILFSYHGLPLNQVENTHKTYNCDELNCKQEYKKENHRCYQAACYATTRLLVKKLKLSEEKYTTSFQSRLSKKWLSPFSDEVIVQKAKEGAKKILVFSPAFVADCLETKIEIGFEYNQLFKEYGGDHIQLVESLNDSDAWIDCLEKIIKGED